MPRRIAKRLTAPGEETRRRGIYVCYEAGKPEVGWCPTAYPTRTSPCQRPAFVATPRQDARSVGVLRGRRSDRPRVDRLPPCVDWNHHFCSVGWSGTLLHWGGSKHSHHGAG